MKNLLQLLSKVSLKRSFFYTATLLFLSTLVVHAQSPSEVVVQYPWTCNFEQGITPEFNQIFLEGSTSWTTQDGGYHVQGGNLAFPQNAHSGISNLYFFSENVGSKTRLILPMFNLDGSTLATLSFWHAQFAWSSAQDILRVVYKNEPLGEWMELAVYEQSVEEWTERTIELPNANSTYWIGFEGTSGYGRGIVIDDIKVSCQGCYTGCLPPKNARCELHLPNYFDATLRWNAPNTEELENELTGFNIYDGTGAILATTAPTETFHVLENLEPIGDYGFGITALFSDGCESEMVPINFTLNNPSQINIPKSGTIEFKTCGATIYDDGGSLSDYSNNCNGKIVIRPAVEGGAIVVNGTFNTEAGKDKLHVYDGVGTNGSPIESFSGINGIIPPITSSTGPITLHFESDGSTTASGFAIYAACANQGSCPPPMAVISNVLSDTSVTLSWESAEAGTFEIEYGVSGFIHGHGTTVSGITTTTYTITNLVGNTAYDVYVKGICGAGETSEWSAVATFSTMCSIEAIPFSEGFEGIFLPLCWENIHTDGSSSLLWTDNTITDYVHSGTKSAKLPDMPRGNKTNLITPPILIPEENQYQVSFWMFRSDSYNDRTQEGVKVWANTTADTINGTALIHVRRSYTQEPAVNEPGWYKYAAVIPSSGVQYIIFQGISEYGNSSYIDDVHVSVAPTCFSPTELSVDSTTSNSAILSWTAGGSETLWNIQYGLQGFEPGTGTVVSNVTLPYELTELDPASVYSFMVQAVCSDTDTSEWSFPFTFNTDCAPISVPYTENFDTYGTGSDAFPMCWFRPCEYESLSYTFPSCVSAYSNSSPNSLKFQSDPTIPTYAISPSINAELHNLYVSFFLRKEGSYSGEIHVGVMSSPTDTSTFELVEIIAPTVTGNWGRYEVLFSNTSLTGTNHYIAFKHVSDRNNWFYWLDDVSIKPIPTCPRPINITLGEVDANSATLHWEQPAGTPQSWNIEYGLSGFSQGSGTIITAITDTFATISGLSNATDYEAYVQAVCGDDDLSEWTGPFSFSTICGVFSTPLFQDFSSTTYPPFCWERMRGLASDAFAGTLPTSYSSGWVRITNGNGIPTPHVKSNIYGSSCKSWLVTPSVSVTEGNVLAFDLALTKFGSSNPPTSVGDDDKFMVLISTDNGLTWLEENAITWGSEGSDFLLSEIPASGQIIQISLSDYANSTIQVAFYTESTVSNADNDLHVGNIYIGSSNICVYPTNVEVSNITENSATIAWQPGENETSWQVTYGPTGFNPDNGDTIITTDNNTEFILTGLTSGSAYSVCVRAICEDDNYSTWSLPANFSTNCGITSIPLLENFETYGTGADAFPPCWKRPVTYSFNQHPSCVSEQHVSGQRSLKFQSAVGTPTFAVLPLLDADITQLRLSFQLRREGSSSGVMKIGLMTDPNDVSTFVEVATINPESYHTWNSYSQDFITADIQPGTNYYIAFSHHPTSSVWYYWLDDVEVDLIPTCPAPINLSATNLTDSSATLTWIEAGTANSWVIEYGEGDFALGTGTQVQSTQNPYLLSGLSTGILYTFYVKSICDDNDVSSWSTPYSFRLSSGDAGCYVIGEGTETTYAIPLNTFYKYSYTQQIFTSTEVEEAGVLVGSSIEQIAFQYIYSTPQTKTQVTIGLTEVSRDEFESSTDWEPWDNFEEVFQGSITFDNLGEDNWVTIDLEVPYQWNGENLVIAVLNNHGSYTTSSSHTFSKHTSSVYSTLRHQVDGSPLIPQNIIFSGTKTKDRNNIKLCAIGASSSFCRTPKQLSVSDTTATSVVLDWVPRGDETQWEVEYGPSGFLPGTGTNIITSIHPLNINNLTPSTSYDFYLRAICGADNISDRKAVVHVQTRALCAVPSNLVLQSVSSTEALFLWTADPSQTSFNVQYGPAGFQLGDGIIFENVTSPHTIIGLTEGVLYEFYVQANCGSTAISSWVGPVSCILGATSCSSVGDGTTGTYEIPLNTYYKYSYSQQIYESSELAAAGVPIGNINSIAYQYIHSVPQTKSNIEIYLANVEISNFQQTVDWVLPQDMQLVFTGTIDFNNEGEDNWVNIPFDQSFAWTGGNILVAFSNKDGDYYSGANQTFLKHSTMNDKTLFFRSDATIFNVDSPPSGTLSSSRSNIRFCAEITDEGCTVPQGVTIRNITTSTATISWEGASGMQANIQYGSGNFIPSATATLPPISNNYTITGLSPGTDYSLYLQAICSNELSGWTGPFLFTTPCDMTLTIPFIEDFEQGVKPECWINESVIGNNKWRYQAGCFEGIPDTAFAGNYNALLYSPNGRTVTRLVSPKIDLSGATQTPIVSFAAVQPYWGFGTDKLSVLVKNSPDAYWTKLWSFEEEIPSWTTASFVLQNPSNSYWIAFEVEGNWGHGVALDNIQVLQAEVAPINGPASSCAFSTQTYTTTSGMNNYVWNVVGGTIVSGQGTNSIEVTWNEPGIGYVNLIYAGLTYQNNYMVSIQDAPEAEIVATESTICAGESTTLTVIGGSSYQWSTGETTTSITVSPTQTTTYTVEVSDNLECATTLSITITVAEAPNIQINGGDGSICLGESVTLTATGGVTYLWSTGSTNSSITVSPTEGTHYSVIGTDSHGCQSVASTEITVIIVNPPEDVVATQGANHILLTWTHIIGATKYDIFRNNAYYASSNITQFEDTDVVDETQYCYKVRAVQASCESEFSNEACITASTCETPSSLHLEELTGSLVLSWSAVANAQSYKIYRDGTLLENTTSTTYTDSNVQPNTLYCYTVSSICEQGESPETAAVCGQLKDGVVETGKETIKIYPNPANNHVIISCPNMEQIVVNNLLGQTIEQVVVGDSKKVTINTSDYESGIYFIIVKKTNGDNVTNKLIINR